MCNKRFNVSAAQSLRLETLLKPLYYKDKSFDCFERALDKNNQPASQKLVQPKSMRPNAVYFIFVNTHFDILNRKTAS